MKVLNVTDEEVSMYFNDELLTVKFDHSRQSMAGSSRTKSGLGSWCLVNGSQLIEGVKDLP